MNNQRQIVYYVYREALSSIMDATVLTPQRFIKDRGYNNKLLVSVPIGQMLRSPARKRWNELTRKAEAVFCDGYSVLPSPPSRLRKAWDEALLLKVWFRRYYSIEHSIIFHCRGEKAACLALDLRSKFPNVKVIYDMRGLSHYEVDYSEKSKVFSDEQRAAYESNAVICVSQSMRKYAIDHLGARSSHTHLVSNAADIYRYDLARNQRNAMRSRNGWNDKFLVVFVGSLRWWHAPAECVKAFKAIQSFEPSAHFLILSGNQAKMKSFAEMEGLSSANYTIQNVPYSEVPDYLCAADIGLGLLAPGVRTEVCAPVKFAEYLAAGLPIITIPNVGDFSEIVSSGRVGVDITGDPLSLANVDKLQKFIRYYRDNREAVISECVETARNQFSWDKNIQTVCNIYSELLHD